MRNRPAPEVLVTLHRALQILESHAPEVLVSRLVLGSPKRILLFDNTQLACETAQSR